ncbi:MAG: hypothetical protein IT204_24350 [Fimbriimonadaceae bacterium]|nr:hypothetical protein [Fimbriimonadaceae bacterium]
MLRRWLWTVAGLGLLVRGGAAREALVLPETWQVQPAAGPDQAPDPTAWAAFPARDWRGTQPVGQPPWRAVDHATVHRLWYLQSVTPPAHWQGQRILADFRRIEGDALVYLNDQRVTELLRPGGEVDLTAHLRCGQANTLRVYVTRDYHGLSRGLADDPLRRTARAADQPLGQWPLGITAPVTLLAWPRPVAVTDTFVQTSWRRRELTVDVELDAATAVTVTLAGQVQELAGRPALELPAQQVSVPAGRSVQRLIVPWANPTPWELEAAHLYRLHLRLERDGKLVEALPPQTFGFREIWTAGRQLLLNGHPSRWRLVMPLGLNVNSLSLYRLLGYNVIQIQPNPSAWWGNWSETPLYDDALLDHLDAQGCGLTLPAPSIANLRQALLSDPRAAADYQRELARWVRRYRQHPCVLAWAVGMNSYCPPANIHAAGMGRRPAKQGPQAAVIERACQLTRQLDPTRLVFSHADGSTGDLSTSNVYLNFVPLQERQDWPQQWATDGELPYSAVEFGEPYTANFWKGSRFLLTEYLAIYQGDVAYRREGLAGLRRTVDYGLANTSGHGAMSAVDLADYPGYWDFQQLFVTATDRAWRTWGVNGGWMYWNWGLAYGDPPGYRGNVFGRYASLPEPLTTKPAWAGPGWDLYRAQNQPLLAYLAGHPQHTDQTHAYRSGERLTKQVALVWDGPGPLAAQASWRLVTATGQTRAQGSLTATLGPGDIRLLPFTLTLPQVAARTELRLELTVRREAATVATDSLPLQVFAPTPRLTPAPTWLVWDPVGRTVPWLSSLGVRCTAWTPGQPLPERGVLVIGRQALQPGRPLPFGQAALARGLRVLLAEQEAGVWEGLGLQVLEVMPRRLYARTGLGGVSAGLQPADLVNWRGAPDLLPAGRQAREQQAQHAPKGSNTHALASLLLRLPQVVGSRAELVGEFDLDYTALLRWQVGRGELLCSTLDLTDRVGADPAATTLARNLVLDLQRPLPAPRRAQYTGGPAGAALLTDLGVTAGPPDLAKPADAVLLIGEAATVDPAAVRRFAAAGGRVIWLPRPAAELTRLGFASAPVRLYRTTPPSGAPFTGSGLGLWRWRDELRVDGFASTGQPAGVEVLADGLAARRVSGPGWEVFLQLSPAALADRYPDDAARRAAVQLSVQRLTQLLAQVLTAAGLPAGEAVARRLTSPVLGAEFQDLPAWRVGPAVTVQGPPAAVLTSLGGQLPALAGRAAWAALTPDRDGLVDLAAGRGLREGQAVWAAATITSPMARCARLRLGVDYYLAAWLNDELVYRVASPHGAPAANRHQVDLDLRAGANELLLLLLPGSRGAGFWASLSAPGWDPARLAGDRPDGARLYDPRWEGADPYVFTYW